MSVAVPDLGELPYLHEPAILDNLRVRHCLQKEPYTRTGDIVIAVNPYQWFHEQLYSEKVRRRYAEAIVWNNTGGNSNNEQSTSTSIGTARVRNLLPGLPRFGG